MSRVIRISEQIYGRLQKLAVPFDDTPAKVIERLLDLYDARHHIPAEPSEEEKFPGYSDLIHRPSRARGAIIEVEGHRFIAESIHDLYGQILRFLVDEGYLQKLKRYLPITTSPKRYLLAAKPVHPNGNDFVSPVEYRGYYMESHKDYKEGIIHLWEKMLKPCGLSLAYLGIPQGKDK